MKTNIQMKLNQKEMLVTGLQYHFSPFRFAFEEVIELYNNLSSYIKAYENAMTKTKNDAIFRIDDLKNGSLNLVIRETLEERNENTIIFNEGEEFFQTFACVVSAFIKNEDNKYSFV